MPLKFGKIKMTDSNWYKKPQYQRTDDTEKMDDVRRNLQDNIRNSLNAINSVSEALIIKSQKSPEIKPYVERIKCQVSKLKSYIDDIQKHMVMVEANESLNYLPTKRHKLRNIK